MPNEQLTLEQLQQEGLRIAIEWRDKVCPRGLLDPSTGGLHPITAQKIGAYIEGHDEQISVEWLNKAVHKLWEKLVWFGQMPPRPEVFPPKPKRPLKEPKYEPPLRPCDARRVNREYHEAQEKQRQEAQAAADKALKKQQEAKKDVRPGAVYRESGPRAGQIDWAATKKLQDQWDVTHFNF